MQRIIGYTRVSTEQQAEQGVSLDAQSERINAWCKAHGHKPATIHTDAGISGKTTTNRPALQSALDEVCKAKGVLVVYSLTRLARSTRDALDIADRLKRAGAHLVSLTESIDTTTPHGSLFFTMMSALGEFERSLLAERTKNALQHKRAAGEKLGGHAPIGFSVIRVEGSKPRLQVDAGEQLAVSRIIELRAAGQSFRDIGEQLAAEGIQPKRGTRWHAKVIRDVCNRHASKQASTLAGVTAQ